MRAIVLPPSSADLLFGGGGLESADSPLEGGRAFVVQRDWFGAARGSSSRGEGETQKEHQRQKEEERGGKRNRRGRQREKREREEEDHPRRASLLLLLHDFLEADGGAAVSREGRVCWERERGRQGCVLAFLGNGDVEKKHERQIYVDVI